MYGITGLVTVLVNEPVSVPSQHSIAQKTSFISMKEVHITNKYTEALIFSKRLKLRKSCWN